MRAEQEIVSRYHANNGGPVSRRNFFKNAAKIAGGVVIAGGLVSLAAACGESTARLEGQSPVDIWIVRGKFVPQKIMVNLGDTVTWTNKDDKQYIVVSDSGLFKEEIPPGGTYSFKYVEHNNHRYHVISRPRMKGLVFVEPDLEANCTDCHG